MNEGLAEENIEFATSRQSTNDSNDLDSIYDSQLNSQRSNGYDEADLEQNSLQFHNDRNTNNDLNNITTTEDEEESQEFRQLQRLAFDSQMPKQTCADQFLSVMNSCFNFITKGFYYLSLIVYHLFTTLIALTQAVLFSTVTLLFAFNVLSLQDLSSLFDVEVTSRRQRQIRRQHRSGRPYSINQRRFGRDYEREFTIQQLRRIRLQRNEEQEYPMTEMAAINILPTNTAALSLRDMTQSNDNQIITEDSTERLSTQGNDSISSMDEHIMRMQRSRDQRVRRDLIRNEILRILTSSDFDRTSRGSQNSFLLRNLQYLQMSTMARDFNENDYEMLSSLDSNNYRRISSTRAHVLISQLPTYKFQAKKGTQSQSKCAKDFEEDDISSFQDAKQEYSKNQKEDQSSLEQNHKNTCTICIEGFVDEEIIKILPCFHQFHSQCIDDWLLRKTLCPVCKFDIKQAAQNERMLNQQLQEV